MTLGLPEVSFLSEGQQASHFLSVCSPAPHPLLISCLSLHCYFRDTDTLKERLKGTFTRQENQHEPEELEGSGILLWGSVIRQHEPSTTACGLTPAEPLTSLTNSLKKRILSSSYNYPRSLRLDGRGFYNVTTKLFPGSQRLVLDFQCENQLLRSPGTGNYANHGGRLLCGPFLQTPTLTDDITA